MILRREHHRTFCLQTVRCLALALSLIPGLASAQTTLPPTSIHWSPETLESGSPVFFDLVLPSTTISATGTWQGHTLEFFHHKGSPHWYALAAIDLEVKPGSYPVAVSATLHDQTHADLQQQIPIGPAPYAEVTLDVPEKFVSPNPAALKIIAADQAIKAKAFAHSAYIPLWSGDFRPPLPSAPRSDSFGTRRVFNGSLASIHRGLDYRAKTGTRVTAINSGRVLLARPLYYEGNCVVIDHGLGLLSIYMHLSHFEVHPGQTVRKGQLIALSGSTGRATGPHLHLGVRWQGTYLDGAKLFQLQLPTNEPTIR
jgi:hypothetical protein